MVSLSLKMIQLTFNTIPDSAPKIASGISEEVGEEAFSLQAAMGALNYL